MKPGLVWIGVLCAAVAIGGCAPRPQFMAKWYRASPPARADAEEAEGTIFVMIINKATHPLVVHEVAINDPDNRLPLPGPQSLTARDPPLIMATGLLTPGSAARRSCTLPTQVYVRFRSRSMRVQRVPIDGVLPSSLLNEWIADGTCVVFPPALPTASATPAPTTSPD